MVEPTLSRLTQVARDGKTKKTLFKMIAIVIYGPGSQLFDFDFLNNDANVALIEKNVAENLHLTDPCDLFVMCWTKGFLSYEKKREE